MGDTNPTMTNHNICGWAVDRVLHKEGTGDATKCYLNEYAMLFNPSEIDVKYGMYKHLNDLSDMDTVTEHTSMFGMAERWTFEAELGFC